MTYRDLKAKLEELTDDQLNQTVEYQDEGYFGVVEEILVAEDDYINPSGDGAEPIGEYREVAIELGFYDSEEDLNDDLKTEPIVFKKGAIYIIGGRK